jgi:hypothetical protein
MLGELRAPRFALRYAEPRARSLPTVSAKLVAAGLSLLVVAAVLSPIVENWRENPRDSFPLSYYPMFSLKREETGRVTYLAAFDAHGNRFPIAHQVVGPGGLNQVRRQITKRVDRGEASKLCQSVSSRVGRRQEGRLADVVTIQVVTGMYRLDGYFSGDKSPVAEHVHASCDVKRPAAS